MDAVALPFAILGFIFGMAALAQVTLLKKEVERLRDRLR